MPITFFASLLMYCVLMLGACGGTPAHPAVAAPQRRATLHLDNSLISSATFSRSGRYLAFAGVERQVRVWDVSSATVVGTLLKGGVSVAAGADDDTWVVFEEMDPDVLIWNWRTNAIRRLSPYDQLKGFSQVSDATKLANIVRIAVSPDGTTLLSLDVERRGLMVWDLVHGAPQRFIEGSFRAVAFLPDGHHAVAAGDQLVVCDLTTGAVTPVHTPSQGEPYDAVVIAADGERVIAVRGFNDRASGPTTLDVIALPARKLVRTIEVSPTRPSYPQSGIALSSDGNTLVALIDLAGDNKGQSVAVFDVATGTTRHLLAEQVTTMVGDLPNSVSAVAIAPDGCSFVIGYRDLAVVDDGCARSR